MSKSTSVKKDKEQSVNKIYDSFKENLFGIGFYFEKFGRLAITEDKDVVDKTIHLIDEYFAEIGIDPSSSAEEIKKLKLPKDAINQLARKLTKQPPISIKNFEILSSGSFLMLNNYFEYLLTDLLIYHYSKFKSSLNSREFKVSLKELEEYNDLNELSEALILKEVETMLIELTFDQLLNHFTKDLAIDLNDNIVNWELIKECRERRHLIVHNSSIVNKKYLARTKNPDKLKVGDKINVSKEYFDNAYEEFRLAGMLLLLNCWGKWDKDKTDSAITKIVDETFDGLQNGQINFVFRFTEYLPNVEPRNEDQEDRILRARFNRCIALKKLNKKEDLKKTLKNIKVGTASPVFKLAHAILSDKDNVTIKKLLRQSYTLKEIDIDDYNEWPMFDFLREDEKLNSELLGIFKK